MVYKSSQIKSMSESGSAVPFSNICTAPQTQTLSQWQYTPAPLNVHIASSEFLTVGTILDLFKGM